MIGIDSLLRIIAPHSCLGCKAEDFLLCPDCARQLPDRIVVNPPLAVWSATAYSGLAKAVLYELKFGRVAAAADDIARCIADRLPDLGSVLVTHVPTAPVRVRQRGYDQAALIAKHVARHLGATYRPLLARINNTRQVGQSRAVRQQQMQMAFRIIHPVQESTSAILLVDDVLTTGSTLAAAASVLRAAGATSVQAAVFAAA